MKKKINLYTRYGSDTKKELEGVPFYIDKDSDTYIKVARWSGRNIEHFKAQAEVASKLAHATENEREKARVQVFIKHLITGWNNIIDRDGNDLEFSEENALALLSDLPDLVDELFAFSTNRSNYSLDGVETTVKN